MVLLPYNFTQNWLLCSWYMLELFAGSWYHVTHLGHLSKTSPVLEKKHSKTLQLLDTLTRTKLPNKLLITVLSMLLGSYRQIKCNLSKHFNTAACSVIARHWRCMAVPLMAEWACEMNNINHVDHMNTWDEDKSEFYNCTLTAWSYF